MMPNRLHLSCPFVAFCLLCQPCVGQNAEEEAKHLLRGVQAARHQLLSGVAEFVGVDERYRLDEDGQQQEKPRRALYAFDYPAEKLRFDSHRMNYISVQNAKKLAQRDGGAADVFESPDFELMIKRLNSVRTPEGFFCYEGTGGVEEESQTVAATNVEIFRSDQPWSGHMAIVHSMTDPRSFGLIDYWDFEGMPDVTGGHMPEFYIHNCDIDVVIQNLINEGPREVEQNGELTLIRFHRGLEIQINTDQGMTPVTYTHQREELLKSSVEWQEQNGAWVPVKIAMERLDWPEKDEYARRTYEVRWSYVNEKVPDEYFDFRNFPDVRDGTPVMDNRGDKPVDFGTWEGGTFVALEKPEQVVPEAATTHRSTGFFLLVNGAVVLSLLIAYAAWSKRRTA